MTHTKTLFRTLALCAALAVPAAYAKEAPVAHAQATAAPTQQAAGYYHMKLGNGITVTALYDGFFNLVPKQLLNISAANRDALFQTLFAPQDKNGIQTAVNAYLINQNGQLTLIDTGAGSQLGEGMGHISANLAAAGIRPEQISRVILTHLHPDHAGGLIDKNGNRLFPNAVVYAPKEDVDFFLSPTQAGEIELLTQVKQMAAKFIAPYQAAGKFQTFRKGENIQDIETIDEFGHTPGMSGYLVGTGANRLLIWGDVVHSHTVQFRHPEATFEYDADRAAALATRRRIFRLAQQNRLWIGGAHLPFPGIGHVVRDGRAYRWVPAEYLPLNAQQAGQ